MGALTFDALLRSLTRGGQGGRGGGGAGKGEGAPDAVYYLHGDEDVLKDEAIRALVDRALDAGARDFNLDQRSAGDLDPEAFHSLVNTLPLLAAARVVVLRGVEDVRKTSKVRQALVRYLQAPNPTTLLILVQGAGAPPDAELARLATSVAIEPLPGPRVRKWVAHRARARASGNDGRANSPGARHGPDRHGPRHGRARPGHAAGPPRCRPARPPARRAAVRPGELGADGGTLGGLGDALERRLAPRSVAPRARCRSRPQVDHAHRRTRNPGAAGARVRRATAGGSVTAGRTDGRTVGRVLVFGMLLSASPAVRLRAQASPSGSTKTDSVRAAALRIAQTRPDSGRAMLRRLLASLSPQDSLYPGALFTAARIAHDAVAAATNLQREIGRAHV